MKYANSVKHKSTHTPGRARTRAEEAHARTHTHTLTAVRSHDNCAHTQQHTLSLPLTKHTEQQKSSALRGTEPESFHCYQLPQRWKKRGGQTD